MSDFADIASPGSLLAQPLGLMRPAANVRMANMTSNLTSAPFRCSNATLVFHTWA